MFIFHIYVCACERLKLVSCSCKDICIRYRKWNEVYQGNELNIMQTRYTVFLITKHAAHILCVYHMLSPNR